MENFKEQFDKAIGEYATFNLTNPSKVPAHSHKGTDSLRVNYFDLQNKSKNLLYRVVDPATNTAVATLVGGDISIPFNGYVMSVGATVDTAGTTNPTTVDINKNGTTILATKITIDSGEKTSRTATTLSIVDVSVQNFTEGDVFTFDIDAISTTPAKGLTVFMNLIQL